MANRYVAFLRGINVGGHHKVPMAELKKVMQKMGYSNVQTLLNSGNIIFDATDDDPALLEEQLGTQLEESFGFPIPTIVRDEQSIQGLFESDPFKGVPVTKDTRLYISLLKSDMYTDLTIPWSSDDSSFQILEKRDKAIISVLDLSISGTPKAMEILEKHYRKENITTRNWKTIERIVTKL